jgi:hypothetical protein
LGHPAGVGEGFPDYRGGVIEETFETNTEVVSVTEEGTVLLGEGELVFRHNKRVLD